MPLDAPFELVVTLGPASFGLASDLAKAGATTLRLNSSHMDLGSLRAAIEAIRTELPALPVVIDLQGAKMRLGRFPARVLHPGDRVVFSLAPADDDAVPLPHPELFRETRPGDTLRVDDGRLHFEVERTEPGSLWTVAHDEGTLRPRKGVNVVEHPVELEDLSDSDVAFCQLASRFERITCAVSFMKDGREAAWVRRRAPGSPVVGKVERREAIAALPEIATSVDAVWICRGDLGAQLGPVDLARFVASFDPRSARCPVLMAGQVLEHVTAHEEPTRSEVCHLYDLVARGYGGIVLSDETAIGADPLRAVRTAVSLISGIRG
jgi:pyruvate kinase